MDSTSASRTASRPPRGRLVGLLALLASSGCALPGPRSHFGPAELVYPVYRADPRRPTFALTRLSADDSEIAGAGDSRYGIRMGSRFGIVRFQGSGPAMVQLDAEVGLLSQFDRDNSSDNLGWDGLYGLFLTWSPAARLGFLLGAKHDSSHVGDELIESTGRMRIDYTREELVLGTSALLSTSWRTYAEYGHGYDLRNEDVMEPGRGQAGLEFESAWNAIAELSPFAAVDVSAFEENDWETNLTVQAGLVGHAGEQTWRFGLEYYDGRTPLGEFFQEDEKSLSGGIWLDL